MLIDMILKFYNHNPNLEVEARHDNEDQSVLYTDF